MSGPELTPKEKEDYQKLQQNNEKLSKESNDLTDGSYVPGQANQDRDDRQNQIAAEQDENREKQRKILDNARNRPSG
jgi:cell division protein FtsB